MGASGEKPVARGEAVQFNVPGKHGQVEEPVKVDNIMLDYLLPSIASSNKMFALPPWLVNSVIRKPLRRIALRAALAVPLAVAASIAALSLLPINECDLLGSSSFDDGRIGPPTHQTVVETLYLARAQKACREAVATEPSNGRYHYQLGRLLDKDSPKESYQQSLEAVKAGYAAGYNAVGYQLANAIGTSHNEIEAERNYNIAIKMGNTSSLLNLADLAGRRNDQRLRFELMTKYVDKGGIYTWQLAVLFRSHPEVVAKDIPRYLKLVELGVRRGDEKAANELGTHYQAGEYGLPVDVKHAFKLYELGVRFGVNGNAAVNLANLYRFGSGMSEPDMEKATYWAIFAAKLGNSAGFETLIDLISSGNARFKDNFGPPESVGHFEIRRLLAESGDANHQLKLAQELEKLANRSEAIEWYRKAASSGNADAQEALKRLLEEKK
jgi:TPR repeat protein